MSADGTLLVVGGGTAGVELAFAARQSGWSGPVALLGAEPRLPYHRPPLSKGFLLGKESADKLPLRPASAYEAAKIELRTGCEVVAVEPEARRVRLADGSTRAYAKLALCVGGRPRPLVIPGLGEGPPPDNAHFLRTHDDAVAIQRRLTPRARVVVIGGGYVGLEVAASARHLGARVTVLEAQPRVLARVVGREVSAFFEGVHRAAGVDLRTGVRDLGVRRDDAGSVGFVEVSGERLAADLVVVGVGMTANTELAAAAGLEVRTGIVVDEHARTSAPDIYAAGDCTELPGGRLYERTIRLESVANATEQARAAAAALCGKPRPYHPVPWFWSEQYDLKLQSVGLADGHDRFVVRGDTAARSFSGFYLAGDRLIAADTVNRPGDFIIAKRLVSEARSVTAEALADEARPLKALLA